MRSCSNGGHCFAFRENRCKCGVISRDSRGYYRLSEDTQKLLEWAERVKTAAAKIAKEVNDLKSRIGDTHAKH